MMHFVRFLVALVSFGATVIQASPSWALYDDDTGSKTEFVLDPSKQCVNAKASESLDFGRKATLVPDSVRDSFIPVVAITSDERKYTEVNRAFCKLAIMLVDSGCNTDKLKIVTRLQTRKLGQVNEGPKGKKYIKEFMIYGCNKLPEGKVAANCVYPKKEDENLLQPMEISAYDAFISRCHDDLYAIGGYSGSDVELEDAKAPLSHITRDPTVAIR